MANFPTNYFSLFFLFLCHSSPLIAFELLPFMQIDNQFYLRLAQCQAKCAEKYGTSVRVRLLNGNLRPFMNWSSPLVELCQVGCLDSDTPSTASQQQIGTDQHPSALAFQQGQLSFRQTAPGNPFLASPPIASQPQILRIRPLCSERVSSPEGLLKSTPYRAMIAIDMAKESSSRRGTEQQPLRFVVQWRRKVRERSQRTADQSEEPKWITASIELDRTFSVTGIRSGHLHQFAVQLVSPSGPLGLSVHSHWIDFDAVVEQFEPVGTMGRISLQFFARYNMDNGVAALVRWQTDGEGQKQMAAQSMLRSRPKRYHRHLRDFTPSPTHEHDATAAEGIHELKAVSEFRAMDDDATEALQAAPTASIVFPACRLQIEWANKSMKSVDEFELDGSDGFLLRHLAFNTDYAVRLLPSSTSSSVHQSAASSPWWVPLHGTFLSMHCSQVYGTGSLECDPEPVRELKVMPSVENGTALISWEMPQELGNILLYEMTIEPVTEVNPGEQCEVKPSARIVSAQSNSVLVPLPQIAICEFHVKVVVYDLLGRDASSQQRFSFIPLGAGLWSQPSPVQFLAHLDGSVLALLSVVVLVPMAAMVTLVCTFSRQSTRRKAIHQKLPGGGEMGRQTPEGTKKKMVTNAKRKKSEADRREKKQQQRRNGDKTKQCDDSSPQSTLTTESSVVGTSITTPKMTETTQWHLKGKKS